MMEATLVVGADSMRLHFLPLTIARRAVANSLVHTELGKAIPDFVGLLLLLGLN